MPTQTHQPAATRRTTPTTSPRKLTVRRSRRRLSVGLLASSLIVCGPILAASVILMTVLSPNSSTPTYEVQETNYPPYAGNPTGPHAATRPLSAVFTPEIQYWAPLIKAWAIVYQVDPNLIATVIQIESCGDPQVSSPSGAQGLFQVMPFHFEQGEDMLDVQTNAQRGLDYLLEGLNQSDGHVGLALAGYNGGHSVIPRGWAAWASETRRYYYWGTRIYSEAASGMTNSPTLQQWLDAGGESLCARASQSQQQLAEQQARSSALPMP